MEIINTLTQYANLINLALLITIIGWLFTLTQQYKEAIKEKYESKVAAKDIEIQSLSERLAILSDQLKFQEQNSNQQLEITKADLQRTEKWYEREKANLVKQLSDLLDKEGVTKQGLVANIDTASITADIKATITSVLKEITVIENKFETTASQQTEHPEVLLALAQAYSLSNQWLEAAKHYEMYLTYYPADWEVQFLRGISYANARQGSESNLAALRSYNEAIVYLPSDADANIRARLFAYRGAIAKRLSRLDEAEADLLIAQRCATADYEIYDIKYNLASIYAMQGRRNEMFTLVSELIGRPEMLGIRAHLNDYFSKYATDADFRKLIR